jgi:hypothetical protein
MLRFLITLFNCFLCYVGWYGAIVLAAYDYPVLAPAILLPIVIWEIMAGKEPMKRFIIVLLLILTGFAVETVLIQMHILTYASPLGLLTGTPPLWVLGLYALIGATFDDIIQWLNERSFVYPILTLIGSVGGGFNYYLGSKIGAISFPSGDLKGVIAAGIVWGLLLPLTYKIRKTI